MTITADTSVQYVPRVGPGMAAKLGRLGITTVGDLLTHLPFRYEDYSRVTPIASIKPGQSVSVTGTVRTIRTVPARTGRRFQQAVVADDTGALTVIWFNQQYLPKLIPPGTVVSLAGKADHFGSKLSLLSPSYEIAVPGKTNLSTGRIVPVYPETEGVTSKWLRGRIDFLLSSGVTLPDVVPDDIIRDYGLMEGARALREVHFPSSLDNAASARRRLGFDEVFLMILTSKTRKRQWEKTHRAPAIPLQSQATAQFVSALPFVPTADQATAMDDVARDLSLRTPMNRLLLGDVGSGKTVVAAYAAFLTANAGYTSAIMAPTQVLAAQHFRSVSDILSPFGIPVRLITGDTKRTASPEGQADAPTVYVGTHALLTDTSGLGNLGLLVVDEQQRFGVRQRALLRTGRGSTGTPHLLTMTATPIPRTVALTLYGHLDLSVLSVLPGGRKKIRTWLVPNEKREGAYRWIREQVTKTGSQVFVVCPFIEESESAGSVKSAVAEYERLRTQVFPDLKLDLLHGRMKPSEKERILTGFRSRESDILVATPVVEVGIDIPGATVILIEGAERFGLSQLHQLRGRVGRNDLQSYCLLFTESDDERTRERLTLLETVDSGPVLAQKDFELRGPGDILGTRQHGIPPYAAASMADGELLSTASSAAQRVMEKTPDLSAFPNLKETVKQRTIRIVSQD